MELIEYIGPKGAETEAGAIVKKACGYLFFNGRPTTVYSDEIAQRLLRFPEVFTRREKGEGDIIKEKAHDVSLIELREQVAILSEQVTGILEIIEPLTELKNLLEAQLAPNK
mgnify:FL=1